MVRKMHRQHMTHMSTPAPIPSMGFCPPWAKAGPRIVHSSPASLPALRGPSHPPCSQEKTAGAQFVKEMLHVRIRPGNLLAAAAILVLSCGATSSAVAPRCTEQTRSCVSVLGRELRLRGGSAAVAVDARRSGPGSGGWKGAQNYLETTGINITATAGSIAAYRSAVTLVNSSYLDDPFAALFARDACPERFKEILALPAPKLVRFAVRTKFFDNFVRDCVHRHGIKQVVLIGAGFDARALRGKDMRWDALSAPTARDMMEGSVLTFYELDLPELMDRKRHLLDRAGMGSRAAQALGLPRTHRIGVDLMSEDWISLLQRYGFLKDRPTAWLLEGFLYYFEQPDVMRALSALSSVSAPGSRIGMSAVSAAAAAPGGGKWKWGSDFPEAVLEEFGWDESVAYELGSSAIAEGWDTSFICPNGAPEPRGIARIKALADLTMCGVLFRLHQLRHQILELVLSLACLCIMIVSD